MADEPDAQHPHQPTVSVNVSEQELAVLARIAGLSIAADRLPAMARDLTVTLRLAGDLDAVLQDVALPIIRPFNPSWPTGEGTGR